MRTAQRGVRRLRVAAPPGGHAGQSLAPCATLPAPVRRPRLQQHRDPDQLEAQVAGLLQLLEGIGGDGLTWLEETTLEEGQPSRDSVVAAAAPAPSTATGGWWGRGSRRRTRPSRSARPGWSAAARQRAGLERCQLEPDLKLRLSYGPKPLSRPRMPLWQVWVKRREEVSNVLNFRMFHGFWGPLGQKRTGD